MSNQNQNMSKNKPTYGPTYTISGSQSASVKYTMNSVVSAIKTVAGNIIAPMSGSSGYVYAPYVPLQTTWLTSPTKSLPSVNLQCNNGKENMYQFALGKSYEFLLNYAKMSKINDDDMSIEYNSNDPDHDHEHKFSLRRHVHEFTAGETMFITEINEVCNSLYYMTSNKNDNFSITFIYPALEQTFTFRASELIDLLEQQIIRELS